MKVAILGYGKMGKEIEKISLFRGHEIIYKIDKESQVENIYNADVAINFSTPETAVQNITQHYKYFQLEILYQFYILPHVP